MESCLYEGTVDHERQQPVKHRFEYGLAMNFIDLAEVPELLRARLLSERRFSPNGFHREDHFGDPGKPLAKCVRELVWQEAGIEATGPIRLLTQLRVYGYYFSPINLFYCYDDGGRRVRAVVAEVQNTPWLERHCYVLAMGNDPEQSGVSHHRHPKSFHVSPFMGINVDYRWQLSAPGNELRVGIENLQNDDMLFRASMRLRRVELNRQSRFRMQCRYPFMTARILAAIYRQAWSLWRKKCPFYPHPRHRIDVKTPLHPDVKNPVP